MNSDLIFILAVVAPQAALAFLAGLWFPRHPLLAGLGTVVLIATILMVTAREGPSAMAPYAVMIAMLAIVPALIIAYLGAKVRTRMRRG